MQRQLWSVNGLSVELGADRRTVAKALDGVTPDGTRSGAPAWYLGTALGALGPRHNSHRRQPSPSTAGPRNRVLRLLIDRTIEWQEIKRGGNETRVTADDIAEWFGVSQCDVLIWLRAGMPYLVEGDFETGAGFVLSAPWSIDWVLMTSALAEADEEKLSASYLCLPLGRR